MSGATEPRRYRWTVIFETEHQTDAEAQVAAAYGAFDSIEADHLEAELAEEDTRV